MNYYEHHIGDYAEATAHLTFVEDAAYSRLIRKYYATEKPIPADLKKAQRLVGAREKVEREAVVAVLEEFFELRDDGWHQVRCDRDIARFKDGEPEREVKKANEDNRLKRHREERARLFKVVTDAGLHAPWNIGMTELRDIVKRIPATEPETGLPTLPATAPATPATATQSPDTSHQTPDVNLKPEASSQASTSVRDDLPIELPDEPTRPPAAAPAPQAIGRNVAISILLRAGGIDATSQNPLVCLDWAENPKVTDELLGLAVVKARTAKPDQRISVNYLKPIVAELLDPPQAKASKADDWEWARSDGGIQRKANELGIRAHGNMSFRDLADKCKTEIQKRKGTRP
jgi:uncharacterized protein YdaU (DUF1376 family)